jgi:hypothetical protein
MTGQQLPIPTARLSTELSDRIHDLCLLWLHRADHQTMGSESYQRGKADALTTAAAELAGEIGGTP